MIAKRIDDLNVCSPFERLSLSPSPSLNAPASPYNRSRTRSQSPLIYVKAPSISPGYRHQASQNPKRSSTRRPLLIISDLNGTLICRKRRGLSFKPRPGLSTFLDTIYTNHTFMIWTSAKPDTCTSISQRLFTPAQRSRTVAFWARDKLRLTAEQYAGNAQVYKTLETVWEDVEIQRAHPHYARGGRWDQTNTLLIDDSVLKAAKQPFNLVNLPELTPEVLEIEEHHAAEVEEEIKSKAWRGQLRAAGVRVESPEVELSKEEMAKLREVVERTGGVPLKAPSKLKKTDDDSRHTAVLADVAAYIGEAAWHEDVSAFVRSNPFASWAGGTGDGADGGYKGVAVAGGNNNVGLGEITRKTVIRKGDVQWVV